jgi:hypothetical protein
MLGGDGGSGGASSEWKRVCEGQDHQRAINTDKREKRGERWPATAGSSKKKKKKTLRWCRGTRPARGCTVVSNRAIGRRLPRQLHVLPVDCKGFL